MKWISVEDKLPKQKERIIVYGNPYHGRRVVKDPVIRIASLRANNLFHVCAGGYTIKVSHWLPLPKEPN